MDLTPDHVYRSCAEAAWDAPGTQRLWNGNQRDAYVELMLARPDWRAIVDVAYRAGWGDHSTLVYDDRAAYRAGREDAARERDEAIKMLADLVVKCTEYGTQDGEFVAMYLLPTGPVHRAIPWLEERGVIVRPGVDGQKAISLGRSVQGDGDSPEEQRPPSKDQGRSEPSWSRVCGPHCIDGYCCDHAEEQRP